MHEPRSPRWQGRPEGYQAEAARLFALDRQAPRLPWSCITTDCEIEMCLDVECMTVHEPKRLEYPSGVCVYCGMVSGQMDHLLPKPTTGEALRRYVLVVPACAACNVSINDFPDAHVGRRRLRAQRAIAKKYRKLLNRPERTEEELAELGPGLRSVALANDAKARTVRVRLAWPTDHAYDLRAFTRSGIEYPAEMGLCDEVALSLADRPYWQEIA
jgi:hypothetical protein